MGTEKKENEVYYFGGDTFNRDGLYCYATADSTCAVSNKINNKNALWSDESLYAIKGVATSEINTVQSTIDELSARVAALEQPKKVSNELRGPKKVSNELRGALKTLKYKREVE